jgi:hypothetical protein
VALAAFGLMARTANLGGQIRPQHARRTAPRPTRSRRPRGREASRTTEPVPERRLWLGLLPSPSSHGGAARSMAPTLERVRRGFRRGRGGRGK